MKVLIYSICYKSLTNIISLLKQIDIPNIKYEVLIINNSKFNLYSLNCFSKKKLNIINNIKNIGYAGALNQALLFCKKNNFTHLVHMNDDIFFKKKLLEQMIFNRYFINNVISGNQLNYKKETVSLGSTYNKITNSIKWHKNIIENSYAPQGSLVSYPIQKFFKFCLSKKLDNYCEEIMLGDFMKKNKIKCFFLKNLKYIHYYDTKLSPSKAYYITKNRIITAKILNKKYYNFFIIFFTLKILINFLIKSFMLKTSYSKSLLKGYLVGLNN